MKWEKMLGFRKWVLFIAVVVLLLSGCGETETKTENNGTMATESGNEVSSEFRPFVGRSGLLVEEGELKESGVVYEDAPITFQDAVIEEMLRNLIGKPEGEVYISELQEIHGIYWRYDKYWSNLQSPDGKLPHVSGCKEGPWDTKQPETLADLAYCYNLQWMEFGSIKVPSLELLYELPQLEVMAFHGTEITEDGLNEIGAFPVLQELHLAIDEGMNWSHLTDGSFILPLADQLVYLDAEAGIDWNVDVLAQMTKLEKLRMSKADDLSFLEKLTELERLYLYCCTPTDWSPLGEAEKLEHLDIGGNYKVIVEIGLEDLKAIEHLDYLEITYTTLNEEYQREEIIEALPNLTGLVTSHM